MKFCCIRNFVLRNMILCFCAVDHEQMDKSPRHSSTVAQMVSPLKLMQRIRSGGGSESLQETNRKMQRALEEALMKNIHLQKVYHQFKSL